MLLLAEGRQEMFGPAGTGGIAAEGPEGTPRGMSVVRRKNAFLSFREVGSSCSFGTTVGTLESPPCVEQRHDRIADESSIKMIIQAQNGYFLRF